LTFNKFDEKSADFCVLSNYFSTMYSLVGRFCLSLAHSPYARILALFFLLLQACRNRDEDNQSPTIQVESPAVGTIFYYLNTINVRATILDEKQIESVTLEVTNSSNIQFLETKEFYPTGKAFDINYTITHNNLYLPSGTYYIKISATDGENESIAFREIQLIEAPRLLERLFVIRALGGNTAIDTLHDNSLMPCISYSQQYLFGGIDSRTQQLVACSNDPSSLLSYSYPEFEVLSTSFPPTNETITAFFHDKQHHSFFWGTQQGNLWRTTTSGTQLFTSTGNAPVHNISAHSNYILAETEGITNNYIHVIRNDNGIIETVLSFNWELKGIIELESENNRVLLIGNENNASRFSWLNLNTGAFNELFNFYDSSPVLSVCDGSGNDFYAVHANGLAHYSNVLDNYTINAALVPTKLVYDDLQHVLFAVNQDQLQLLNETGMNTLQTIATPGILDVWLKYNK
jgi:hypothetical protein